MFFIMRTEMGSKPVQSWTSKLFENNLKTKYNFSRNV